MPRPALPRRALLPALLALAATPLSAGYRIENVPLPPDIRTGISAVAFTPSGALALATRDGELWLRAAPSPGAPPVWRRFARGLDEPMGLVAESDSVLVVAHRPEVLRARDTDGDGRADTFDALGGRWGQSVNYHEFFFGLARDAAGNFYGQPSLDSTITRDAAHKAEYPTRPTRGPRNLDHVHEASGHRSDTPWRGWIVRIAPDGTFTPFASGFRQANGLGFSPEGELFVTDNQGDYKASTGLLHVAAGDFHGHPAGLKWETGYTPAAVTTDALFARLKTPAVVFPHGPMGNSPGEPVWDRTGGRFGPFAGQVFVGDYSRLLVRASLEKVGGVWQGACFPFLGRHELAPYVAGERYRAGGTRAAFGPDGALYVAATAGWGAGENGLQRIAWDGIVSPDIADVTLGDRGFRVSFTVPLDPALLARPAAWELARFRYYYHSKYGSPRVDESRVAITAVRPAADGRSAELEPAELEPGFVYELSVPTLRTADGRPLANPLAYYTANRLRDGRGPVGGTVRLPRPGETSLSAREAPGETTKASRADQIAAGEKIYRFYCVACHQPDGRGLPVPGGAANFVDDRSRLAKSDAELLAIIADGLEAKAMPAFGAILNANQRRAVLAYLRDAFGPKE